MIEVSGVLGHSDEQVPSSEDLLKVHQIDEQMEYLERCFTSDSNSAQLSELAVELAWLKSNLGPNFFSTIDFYGKLAAIYNESVRGALSKGVKATRDLIKEFEHLMRLSKHHGKIVKWVKNEVEQRGSNLDGQEHQDLPNRIFKFFLKYCKLIEGVYNSAANIISNYWNYLPSELQEIFESMARRLVLSRKQDVSLMNDGSVVGKRFVEGVGNYEEATKNLYLAVFKALEDGKSMPRARFSSPSSSVETDGSKLAADELPPFALNAVQSVAEEISRLPGVEQVKIVPVNPSDLHKVTFYLKTSPQLSTDPDFDQVEELWEKAEKLAIQAHHHLRDSTKEKWYFHAQVEV